MCGIAGIVSRDGTPLHDGDIARLEILSRAIAHRGTDDDGIFISPSREVVFAHRRLAIIDPTPEGHQPMVSEAGNVLVFNGEIYNYQELRSKYSLRVPQSDTAVLLALFDEFGTRILPELRGFFTFAYWNERQKELTIARDAFGKKPLYYYEQNGRFSFASEQKALIESGIASPTISREALARYLQSYCVPHPHSIVEGIRILPPGSILRLNAKGLTIERSDELPKHEPLNVSYSDAVKEVRRLLERSVRDRLVSDVPVGAFLSGGLDSNAVVGLMSRMVSSPIETFSIGFASTRVESETKWARIGAEYFGTSHHEKNITARDVANALPKFFAAMDSPTGDGLNSFLVSKAAREANTSLKVVVSGVGGDEAFLGYRKYRWLAQRAKYLQLLWALPVGVRAGIADRLHRMDGSRYANALSAALSPGTIRILYSKAEIQELTGATLNGSIRDGSLTDVLRSDIEHYLPDMLLRDLDVMTMSFGFEARAPLLDKELTEFTWQLPFDIKTCGGSKQLLADAVADILPPALKDKPKTGFELPMREWLLNGELRPYLDELLSNELTIVSNGLLNKAAVQTVHDNFVRGRSHYLKPWSIIALEHWYRALPKAVSSLNQLTSA
jgi:asparagine synthase (glutamine-hydrolysing)